MSIKNILMLVVLMIVGIQDRVQAETMRGMEIPQLDTARMVGDWYLLAVSRDLNGLSCVNSTIAKLSDDSYTMTTTLTRADEAIEEYPHGPITRTLDPLTCTKQENTNAMKCTNAEKGGMNIIHFDVDYDSYAVGYTTEGDDSIATDTDGTISILGRQKTMPEGVLEKVKESNFYKQGLGPEPKMILANTTGCQ